MNRFFFAVPFLGLIAAPAHAAPGLFLAYPPAQHETTAAQIFFVGTAPPGGQVLINGQPVARSPAGHFAPSLPLQLGKNEFTLRYGSQSLAVTVTRAPAAPAIPTRAEFGQNSLMPPVDVARRPDEWICLSALAPPTAKVTAKLADQQIPLQPVIQSATLPPNSAVLTQQNQPIAGAAGSPTGEFRGCIRSIVLGDLGKPEYELRFGGETLRQTAPGRITILSPAQLEVAEVTAAAGTARTGPSTDHSRLTPLPKGTRASVTGSEGDWVRLDYGAWIRRSEVTLQPSASPPTSLIRSIKARPAGDWTEIVFPLEVPVPVSVQQDSDTFTLTLYNTTAQTDIIRLDDDPLIERLDWQQVVPGQIHYRFKLKTSQQWGYQLRYEGTSLVLSLRRPPQRPRDRQSLKGLTILLDPGHGGPEDGGATSPTGYREKDAVLVIAKLLRAELRRRGATVPMTRETDVDVSLADRVAAINQQQPTIALSLHYNALPDSGNAEQTQGISTFWFHPQAHSLAVFLHNYLVQTLNRPSYGIYWNNLALTRPAVTPSVLVELGFLINPIEFEWITNPREQQRLAMALADGITAWLQTPPP